MLHLRAEATVIYLWILLYPQLLVWKSNLHTYDAAQFDEKSLSSSGCDTSSTSKEFQGGNVTRQSNDLSIRIDPRESLAYRTLDEHFQVVDSEHTKQQISDTNSGLEQPMIHQVAETKSIFEMRRNHTPFFN